jgi:RimJ/RimL family protein N-acetyltransferase
MTTDFALETPRLRLRRLAVNDSEFILALYNDPDFIRNIADRGLRTLDDARAFITRGPRSAYANIGYGLLCVEEVAGNQAIGVCGLVKRDELPDSDLGFALLPNWRRRGYAREAATAVVDFARHTLCLPRLLGIVLPSNMPSIHVLEAVGMRFVRPLPWPADGSTISLFAVDLHRNPTPAAATGLLPPA